MCIKGSWTEQNIYPAKLFGCALAMIGYNRAARVLNIVSTTAAYVVPETCVDESCRLIEPLPQSQLPPNLLLIFIHASVREISRRTAIRDTWAKDITNKDASPIQYRLHQPGNNFNKMEFIIIILC